MLSRRTRLHQVQKDLLSRISLMSFELKSLDRSFVKLKKQSLNFTIKALNALTLTCHCILLFIYLVSEGNIFLPTLPCCCFDNRIIPRVILHAISASHFRRFYLFCVIYHIKRNIFRL